MASTTPRNTPKMLCYVQYVYQQGFNVWKLSSKIIRGGKTSSWFLGWNYITTWQKPKLKIGIGPEMCSGILRNASQDTQTKRKSYLSLDFHRTWTNTHRKPDSYKYQCDGKQHLDWFEFSIFELRKILHKLIVLKRSWEYAVLPRAFKNNSLCKI